MVSGLNTWIVHLKMIIVQDSLSVSFINNTVNSFPFTINSIYHSNSNVRFDRKFHERTEAEMTNNFRCDSQS